MGIKGEFLFCSLMPVLIAMAAQRKKSFEFKTNWGKTVVHFATIF